LQPHAGELSPGLWRRLDQKGTSPKQRLRILAVLAGFDPKASRWKESALQVLGPWLSDDPLYLGAWTEALKPVRGVLLGPLTAVFQGKDKQLVERRPAAASILADYAKDEPATLAELVVEADDRQLTTLLPVLRAQRKKVMPILEREVGRQPQPEVTEAARQTLARRQAGGALALARLGRVEALWPLLKQSPYPEARTRLVQRLQSAGVPVQTLEARLQAETDVSIRRALILALGEYSGEQIPEELRKRLVAKLLDWYRHDPDAGIHGAIDWLLRHGKEGPTDRPLDWGQAKTLAKIDEEPAAQARVRRAAALAGGVGAMALGSWPLPGLATVLKPEAQVLRLRLFGLRNRKPQ
jgi:hypothetical protein